ncbi:hypothetical protein [Pseudonocardia aurantiaca]|uniref:Uncharacterized protein n=1 Tax=Pseudonocardia aurantiaca TaxID=75290 RepID=A0ABW4FHY5_9PSEU
MTDPTDEPTPLCHRCATPRPASGAARLAWACEREPDGERWLCPGCARRHAREIEARLAPEWW